MIYLSGVLEITLKGDRQALVVAAWLRETQRYGPAPVFLAFDPETHKPFTFRLDEIERINAVLVR